jgi:DNA-binding LytR/AlgR family response regulator
MKYHCLIVDDERPALKLLTAYIAKLPHLHLAASCENAMEAMAAFEHHTVDMLFLDIHMPDISGLDMLESLKEKPQVIMTTAYRDYAVESFALDVTDYLVKPFSLNRFAKAVNKAIDQINLRTVAPSEITGHPNSANDVKSHFFVRTNYQIEKIILSEILYIESMREYIGIHTQARRYVINKSMNSIEEELPEEMFMRVHRSCIINLTHLYKIKGNLIILGDKEIPIGATYRKPFFDRINLL